MCAKNEVDIDTVIDKIQESIDSFDELELDEFVQGIKSSRKKLEIYE